MKKILLLLLIGSSFSVLSQQQYTGYAFDNYSGYTGSYTQPASITNSLHKFSLTSSLVNLSANNYSGNNSSLLSVLLGNERNRYREPLFKGYQMQNFSLDLISGYYEIDHKNSIGYSFRIRQFGNLDGLTTEWTAADFNNFDSTKPLNTPISFEKFGLQQFIYSEHRFNYARVIQEGTEHFIKAGVAVKIINGHDATYLYADEGSFEFQNKDNGVVTFNETTFEYGRAEKNNAFSSRKLALGFDLGAVYEYRPDYDKFKYDMDGEKNIERYDKNKYLFKIGVSLIDIGRVKFTKDTNSYNFITGSNQVNLNSLSDINIGNFNGNGISFFKNFNAFADSSTKTADQNETFKMNLPTSFNLQFDYNVWKNFYASYGGLIPVKLKSDPTKSHFKAIHSFSARYEVARWSAILPISFQRTGQINVGAAGRYVFEKANISIFAGGNNIMGIFGKRAKYTANFFSGISIGMPYTVPSDIDGDKISDEKDECKYDPGLEKFNGCPDTDGDGIPDKRDYCIYSPGPISTNGCPDTDGDGIIDLDDQCPDEKGLAVHYGCPDRDKDGVIDAADRCPDVPGIELNNGCPFENPGCCMDNDGDGVSNNVDKCPDHAGSVYNDGCPIDSTNINTINLKEKKEEKDPNNTGQKIEEIKEKNPQEPTQDGVQITKLPSGKRLETLNIYFNTDDATVKAEYDEKIRELAKSYDFSEKGKYMLVVIGHTDNDGNDNYNLILSKKRAETVRRKLEGAGVDYDSIEVFYYGEWRPLKSNTNDEAKKFNRRVEIGVQEK